MIAVAELVNVGAEPGADIAEQGKLGVLGARKISRRGQLHVGGLSFERGHRDAGPFGERGIVGEILAAGRFCARVRLVERREIKGLRRLHDAQAGAVERSGDAAGLVHGLDRVGEGQHRHRRERLLRRGNRARDQRARGERASRVVNEHDRGLVPHKRVKSSAHGGLPRPPAIDRRKHVERGRGLLIKVAIAGMDDRLYERDRLVLGHQREALPERGAAEDWTVLLGHVSAGAEPASGGHDHGGDGVGHWVRSRMPIGSWDSASCRASKPGLDRQSARKVAAVMARSATRPSAMVGCDSPETVHAVALPQREVPNRAASGGERQSPNRDQGLRQSKKSLGNNPGIREQECHLSFVEESGVLDLFHRQSEVGLPVPESACSIHDDSIAPGTPASSEKTETGHAALSGTRNMASERNSGAQSGGSRSH